MKFMQKNWKKYLDIFSNLDFILLEKLFSLLCKPGIMSLTLYKQHLCQVIISTTDL